MKKLLLFVFMTVLIVPMGMTTSIIIVTDQPGNETAGSGNLGDYLRSLGYQVTADEGSPGTSAYRGTLTATQITHLESFDLVIFHRSTGSGSFVDYQWNTLKVPLINGSSYTARNQDPRWDWLQGPTARETSQYLFVDEPDHPIFMGVNLDAGFLHWYSEDQDFDVINNSGDVGNGTLLAETESNYYTAIAVWDNAGAFFPGGAATHTARRIFLSLLRYFEDDGSGTISFKKYTDDAKKVIANAVEYAITGEVTGNPPVNVANWPIFE